MGASGDNGVVLISKEISRWRLPYLHTVDVDVKRPKTPGSAKKNYTATFSKPLSEAPIPGLVARVHFTLDPTASESNRLTFSLEGSTYKHKVNETPNTANFNPLWLEKIFHQKQVVRAQVNPVTGVEEDTRYKANVDPIMFADEVDSDDDIPREKRIEPVISAADIEMYRNRTFELEKTNESAKATPRSQQDSHRYKDADNEEEYQEQAAVRIQARYRGYAQRKELAGREAPVPEDGEAEKAATKIQARFRGNKVRGGKSIGRSATLGDVEKVEEEPAAAADGSFDDAETGAATRIQARYRGYQTRKQLGHTHSGGFTHHEGDLGFAEGPEAEAAAVRIQSRYRGHVERKRLTDDITQKEKAKAQSEANAVEHNAAVKIQATFKGHRVRANKAKPVAEAEPAAEEAPKADDFEYIKDGKFTKEGALRVVPEIMEALISPETKERLDGSDGPQAVVGVLMAVQGAVLQKHNIDPMEGLQALQASEEDFKEDEQLNALLTDMKAKVQEMRSAKEESS